MIEHRTTPRIFPFGATYAPFARAKAVPRDAWDADLRAMRALGFTYVNVFAAWHQIEREEGVFDFAELDYLIELAQRHDLLVSIKAAVHLSYSVYEPRWLTRRYTGDWITGRDDKPLIKGLSPVPCKDDPAFQQFGSRYLRALAAHYADSTVVRHWMAWGEPSWTACFCPHSLARFRQWLARKYGSLAVLNTAWGTEGPTDFATWDEVPAPRGDPNLTSWYYTAMVDWLEFNHQNLAAHVRWAHDEIRSQDRRHPTLVELWVNTDDVGDSGNDLWSMAPTADQLGLSIFNTPDRRMATGMDYMRSVAEAHGKEAWVVEEQGGPALFDWISETPASRTAAETALFPWQMVAHGAKAFFYWTYRPRLSDGGLGDFGLVERDGTLTERARLVGETCRQLQQHADLFLDSRVVTATAIFHSRIAEHFASCIRANTAQCRYGTQSVLSAHELLWEANIVGDFISPELIQQGRLSRYRALLMPFAICLTPPTTAALKTFVRDGGMVIADFGCGYYDEQGLCATTTPGAGLAALFGAEGYEADIVREERIRMEPASAFSFAEIAPYTFTQHFRLAEGTEILARFSDGTPAIVRRRYGKGQAVLVGTMLFHRDAVQACPANRELVTALLAQVGVHAPVRLSSITDEQARLLNVVRLESGGSPLIMLLNHNSTAVQGSLCIHQVQGEVYDLLTAQPVASVAGADGLQVSLAMPATSCRIWQVRTR